MTVVLGHRGGRGADWPEENSLAAFERAIRERADGVELDVRLSADGAPVLVHDATLADGRFVHRIPRHALRAPTLDDALDLLAGRVVNVELKRDVPSRRRLARVAVAAALRARAVDVIFSSFDPFLVFACAALAPGLPRAILVGQRTPRLATPLPIAMRSVISAAHLDETLITDARVARLAKAGLRTCAWTVNDPARARALVKAGVPWIITDAPGLIRAALR